MPSAKHSARDVTAMIDTTMRQRAFATDPDAPGLWWYRRHHDGTTQAVRTVIWGANKPNPHVLVEVIASMTPETMRARDRLVEAGDVAAFEAAAFIRKVSLTQPLPDAAAELAHVLAEGLGR